MLTAKITRKGRIDPRALNRAVDRWLPQAVFSVTEQASLLAPVDTGNLRASIHGRVEGRVGIVGTGPVKYAEFQEYGTRFMPAQPFLRPAIDAYRKRLTDLLRRMYAEEVRKDAK